MTMKVKEYCTNMGEELSGWKTKLLNVVGTLDSFPLWDRALLSREIDDIRTIIDELVSRIERLKTECSPEQGAMPPEIQGQATGVRNAAG